MTTDTYSPWMSDEELLEWLGPDWGEETTPPARWVPVEPAEIRVGDYVRCEFPEVAEALGIETKETDDGEE